MTIKESLEELDKILDRFPNIPREEGRLSTNEKTIVVFDLPTNQEPAEPTTDAAEEE